MIIFKKKNKEIVKVIESSLDVIQARTNKFTLYSVDIEFDPNNAAIEHCQTITAHVYTQSPAFVPGLLNYTDTLMLDSVDSKQKSILNGSNQSLQMASKIDDEENAQVDARRAINGLLYSQMARRRSMIRSSLTRIYSKNFDIYSDVNDAALSEVSAVSKRESSVDIKTLLTKNDRNLILKKVDSLLSFGIDIPVPIMNTDQNIGKKITDINLILTHGIDPHENIAGKNSIILPKNALGGSFKNIIQKNLMHSSQNIESAGGKISSTISNTVSSKFLPVIDKSIPKSAKLKLNIELDNSKIDKLPEIFLVLEINSSKNNEDLTNKIDEIVIQRLTKSINHRKNIDDYEKDIHPPAASVIRTINNTTSLVISQIDTKADGIIVLKRKINNNDIDSEFVEIYNGRLLATDGVFKFADKAPLVHNTIYRIFSTRAGKTSTEFTSALASASKNDKFSLLVKRDISIPLHVTCANDCIEITPTRIPDDVIAIELIRRNNTINEKIFRSINDIKRKSIVQNKIDSLKFKDRSVKEGHIYEYSMKIIFRDGVEKQSINVSNIEYTKRLYDKESIRISDLTVIDVADVRTLTFDVSSPKSLTNEKKIYDAILGDNVAKDLFDDERIIDKNKLSSIMSYKITRIDTSTGVEEDVTEVNGAEPSIAVNVGRKDKDYKYNVYSQERDAHTMIKTLEATKEVSHQSSSYTYSPNKWLHPQTLKDGTLLSATDKTDSTRFSKSPFSFGLTGKSATIDVKSDKKSSVITQQFVSVKNNKAMITWNIFGDVSNFDHFLININYLGVKKTIGKVSSFKNKNNYSFIDNTNDTPGAITYEIVAFDKSFKRTQSVTTNEVISK